MVVIFFILLTLAALIEIGFLSFGWSSSKEALTWVLWSHYSFFLKPPRFVCAMLNHAH